MSRLYRTIPLLLIACVAQPLAATDFEVVSSTGVVEPERLAAGQVLASKTLLKLEPWGRAVIRETSGCGLTHIIAGASEHPLMPAADCSAVVEPMQVVALVQQGTAFATRVKETGSGPATDVVQMLVQEPCVFLARVSEEGSNSRRCPSGYALRALRCDGDYCDNKDLLCCPYLDGEQDSTAKELGSRVISEEFPNVLQSKGFLSGLACNGAYCDNILPYQFKSSRLVNTRKCEWSSPSSEVAGQWLDCGNGKLMSGIRCKSDYCGDVGVYCCGAEVK